LTCGGRPILHARRAGRAKRPAGRRREDCRALLRKVGGATIAVAKESSAEIGRRRACKTFDALGEASDGKVLILLSIAESRPQVTHVGSG